jgi:hypothetical protein
MADFNLTNSSNLFKIKYAKLSENVYNSATVLLGRVNKTYDFVGKQKFQAIPTGFSGSVGSGTLPTAYISPVEGAVLTAKKVYGVCTVDREAIQAASSDEGAFVRQTKFSVQKTVESFMRNANRIWFGDGTGSLGRGDGARNVSGTGTAGDPYVVVLNTDWVEANFEENDYVNYDAETSLLLVDEVIPSTRQIKLVGTSVGLAALTGVGPVLVTKYFHMQGSRNNDPLGIKGVLDATSSTLYGVTVARRWQAYQVAAGGAGITTDMMNKDILSIEKRCGKLPTMAMTSYTQFAKILNLLEDQKTYNLPARSEALKGQISFKGVEIMTSSGPIPLFVDRFCQNDRLYYLNDNFMTSVHRPGFGWFDDDGTVFLRDSGADTYSARYGGYYENYIVPSFHGVRTGLAV